MSSSDEEDDSTSPPGSRAKTVLKLMITATEALVKTVRDTAKGETEQVENAIDSGIEIIPISQILHISLIPKDPRLSHSWIEVKTKLQDFMTEEFSINQ